ncbi:MAG: DUF935 family protein [Propionibacteriaceae bacterium]|nr:DUF935 family protein [Propionibacteriaceae bacterium]
MGLGRQINDSVRDTLITLAGFLGYEQPATAGTLDLDSPEADRARALFGGQIQKPPVARTRWYQKDVETAEYLANAGDMSMAAQLMAYAGRDGVLNGVMSTRTDGLVRLPKTFRGPEEILYDLRSSDISSRPVFDEMFPPGELALLARDGIGLGVGVGELRWVETRDYPVFVRLDPQYLKYYWQEDRWYYQSVIGNLPITPGDGRWVLHVPGGRQNPWQAGLWRCLARSAIRKDHAGNGRDNWERALANPARVAVAPSGAAEAHRQSWFRKVMAWGMNTVFGLTPGYDVKLLESNGRGADSFTQTIKDQNQEMIIAVAGQTVTTDGGTGFSNADVHKSIRADLIQATAQGLAYTVNTQGIPAYVASSPNFGEEYLGQCPVVEWDTTPPKDLTATATALSAAGQAITQVRDALAADGLTLDTRAMCSQYGIPLKDPISDEEPSLRVVGEAA